MPQKEADQVKEGAIDEHKTPADVQQDPTALPAGFVWSIIDIKKDVEVSFQSCSKANVRLTRCITS